MRQASDPAQCDLAERLHDGYAGVFETLAPDLVAANPTGGVPARCEPPRHDVVQSRRKDIESWHEAGTG